MRGSIRILFSAAAIAAAMRAETLPELQQQWRAVNAAPAEATLREVAARLAAFREQPGGKRWEVNYMLGSCWCRIPGQEGNGKIALHRALGDIAIPDKARAMAEAVLSACGQANAKPGEPPVQLITVDIKGAVVHGKGGYPATVRSRPSTTLPPPGPEELERRVFPPGRAEEAAEAVRQRLKDPSVAVAAQPGYIVAASGGVKPEAVGQCLARYQRPLESQFGMRAPAGLITVYAVRGQQVPSYAGRLHGVELPQGTVAYSVYADLSIVGPGDVCGTLGHELLHLSIRQNFSDSPPWLEEGLAAAVAVAEPSGEGFRFTRSWRDDVLNEFWHVRPTVARLLDATWADYAPRSFSGMDGVTALHGMAAVFIRYLDSRGRLLPVYLAMRDSLASTEARPDQQILEQALGATVDQIDADFVTWFRR